MHVEVEVWRAGEAPRRVRLKNGVTMIGRAPDSELVLPDVGVSRRHARLLLDSAGLTLEDLGSGNGTLVGGERVARVSLREGDEILIDPFTLRIRLSGPVASSGPSQGGVGQDDTALLDQREVAPPAEPQRQARLVSVAGPALQPSYPIGPSGLSMGRSEEREVVLLDPAASRLQAEIVEVDGVYWLRDHGSANGTFVNGRRVRERPLQHDDRIRVGATELRFELSGSRPAAADPALHRRSILPAPAAARTPPAHHPPAGSSGPAPAGRGLAIAVGVGVAVMVLAVGASALAALAWKLSQQVDPSQAVVAPAPAVEAPAVEAPAVETPAVAAAEPAPAPAAPTAAPAPTTAPAPTAAPAPTTAPAPTAAPVSAGVVPGSAMEQGLARFKEGAYLEATALFYRALKEDPTSLDAERMCYVSCEFLAIQTLREDARARQVTPEQREELYRQAVAQGRKAARSGAELDAADQAIAAALEWYPQDPTLVELRGSVEARRARDSSKTASKTASRTASTAGSSSGASASDRRLARQYLDEGMQAVTDGRLVVARDRLARALSLDSSLSSARSNLADVNRILEDRARTAWSQGQAQEAAGNIGGALTAYEQVVAYASSKQASLKTQAQQRIAALR